MRRAAGQRDLFPEAPINRTLGPKVFADGERALLFFEGLMIVRSLIVENERKARILLGRFLKDAGDKPMIVLEALRAAERLHPAAAMPYIVAAIKARRRDSHFGQNVRQMGYRPEEHGE